MINSTYQFLNYPIPSNFIPLEARPEHVMQTYHFKVGGDLLSLVPTSPIWKGVHPALLSTYNNNSN